jgi:hypothetical protein
MANLNDQNLPYPIQMEFENLNFNNRQPTENVVVVSVFAVNYCRSCCFLGGLLSRLSQNGAGTWRLAIWPFYIVCL